MFLLFYLFVFHIFLSWNPCNSQYVGYSITRLREKIINMVRELILDAMVKMGQIECFKKELEGETAFKLGHLQYEVKDRVRRILIIYRHTERLNKKNLKERMCITEMVDVDNLYHDAITFIDMMKDLMGVENIAPGKPVFRSGDTQQVWKHVVEDQESDPVPPTAPPPPPTTPSGKRSNGAWNYAPEPDSDLFK